MSGVATTTEKPKLEPGEHSHRCAGCQHYWKHLAPSTWEILTGAVTEKDYEERHKCPKCGAPQFDRAATCTASGELHDFEDADAE